VLHQRRPASLCDIWERHGSGLTNMHGSTGDIMFLAPRRMNWSRPSRNHRGRLRLGGSGPACALPLARGWASPVRVGLFMTPWASGYNLTMNYRTSFTARPSLIKFKIKCPGCPNDCVASVARADLSIIGTWKDDIQQDDAAVSGYAAGGLNIQKDGATAAPHGAWTGMAEAHDQQPRVASAASLHQRNAQGPAARQGEGATLMIGSKHPSCKGPCFPRFWCRSSRRRSSKKPQGAHQPVGNSWDEYGRTASGGELISVSHGEFPGRDRPRAGPRDDFAPRDNPYIFYQKDGDK